MQIIENSSLDIRSIGYKKKLITLKNNDDQQTTDNKPLSPQDIVLAFISLAFGMSIALTSLFFEHLVNKIAD